MANTQVYKYTFLIIECIDHESKNNANYSLYGISHHSGSLYGGHYIAYILKDNNLPTFSEALNDDGKWYRCNDSHVTSISEADL